MTHVDQILPYVTAFGILINCVGVLYGIMVSRGNRREIGQIKHATNSMKDELVSEVRSAAHAAGMMDEKSAAKGRAADAVIAAEVVLDAAKPKAVG